MHQFFLGVEAQTLTVWRQAERYNVPRIVYVNKMDRKDADITMACKSIEKKLQIPSMLLQLPAVDNGKLVGKCHKNEKSKLHFVPHIQ